MQRAEIKRLEARLKEIDASILKDKIREEANAEKLKDLQSKARVSGWPNSRGIGKETRCLREHSSLELELKAASDREVEIESELQGLKGDRKRDPGSNNCSAEGYRSGGEREG